MTIKINQNPDKVLRQTAKEVSLYEIKSDKIKKIISEMTKAMFNAKDGVAIAAPQIGESLRIFIVDRFFWIADKKKENQKDSQIETRNQEPKKLPPIVFINPIIKKLSKKKQPLEEGCLSAEGFYGIVERSEKVTIEALDENGKKFSRGCSRLLAQIVQHEVDHLNGVLFIDKASGLKKIKRQINE